MKFLSDEMISGLLPAETASFPSPVPTQIVSSDEYLPTPQTAQQREVAGAADRDERPAGEAAGDVAPPVLPDRRGHGRVVCRDESGVRPTIFKVERGRGGDPRARQPARRRRNSGQFIFDGHTHFLRDDTRLTAFVKGREAVGQWGWNKELSGKEQTIDDLKFANYVKETLHGQRHQDDRSCRIRPRTCAEDWFIPQDQVFKTRAEVNEKAGTRRMLAHFTFTPG